MRGLETPKPTAVAQCTTEVASAILDPLVAVVPVVGVVPVVLANAPVPAASRAS